MSAVVDFGERLHKLSKVCGIMECLPSYLFEFGLGLRHVCGVVVLKMLSGRRAV